MKGLRKKSTTFELFLVSCLLLGLTITVAGLQNKEMQFVTENPISDSIGNIYSDNTSTSNTSISNASTSNASTSNASTSNASMNNKSISIAS